VRIWYGEVATTAQTVMKLNHSESDGGIDALKEIA
jgi:hypothetical protein